MKVVFRICGIVSIWERCSQDVRIKNLENRNNYFHQAMIFFFIDRILLSTIKKKIHYDIGFKKEVMIFQTRLLNILIYGRALKKGLCDSS